MLKVLFTVDTEIWCGGWSDLDRSFPAAFRRYVYGSTLQGDFALPGLFRILGEHGLKGVFFVEPLFTLRFGVSPLREIVDLVREAGHEVQLHLHPEWVDEARVPLLPDVGRKRPHLREFCLEDQGRLIRHGLDMLAEAGADGVSAFRAGSYAMNADTLRALAANGVLKDSSYNPAYPIGVADVAPGQILTQPARIHGVTVFPVAAYRDRGAAHLRHLQLTACSFQEIRRVLERSQRQGLRSVVIVAHNFELLTPAKDRVDRLVVRRFRRLCEYLADNPRRYQVCGFDDQGEIAIASQPPPVRGAVVYTAARYAEQLLRRLI